MNSNISCETRVSPDYFITNDTPVVRLDAEIAFKSLTDGEQLYAHYLSKASWIGSLIVLFQTSPESPLIFIIFRRIFKVQSIKNLRRVAKEYAGFNDRDWRSLLVYLSAFLSNMGNYRGFGDSKFIPDLPKQKLEDLIRYSKAYKTNKDIKSYWDKIKDKLYSLNSNELALGFNPNGTTTYFSKNCTEEDSKLVKQFMENNKIEAFNTRVFKDSKTNTFEIRFASILSSDDNRDNDYLHINSNTINGTKFVLSRGDYSPILEIMNRYLTEAQKNARNETEKKMIDEYVSHFRSGSLKAHKDGSRFWIKDKGPVVETYIGFIETYRDPSRMRGEFKGFVGMVNKEMSKKLSSLVEKASTFLPLLEWPTAFLKDTFIKPDYTPLDVLTFSGSGISAGINIPNYNDIRQYEGFKTFSYENVITASVKISTSSDLNPEEKDWENDVIACQEVQVGLHELLGHGSGKLFKMEDQKLNFDSDATINPLTNKKIDKWYKSGETFESKFTTLSCPYEECRAECVALYLCLYDDVLDVFGFSGNKAKEVIYRNWNAIVVDGIHSLALYNPSQMKWLQAHSQAHYVITRVLLESPEGLVNIECKKSPNDGNPYLSIQLKKDHKLIETVGKKAIGDFLLKLQVYKSMGDIESAQQMFDKYSEVSDGLEYPYLKYRDIVLARKEPRKLFVESSTQLVNGKVVLNSYEATHEGLIQSFKDHFDNEDKYIDDIIFNLWDKDINYFV